MNSISKYFKTQMSAYVSPVARDKLFARVVPQMCVDNDICPACGSDLDVYDDLKGIFMHAHAKDRICKQCGILYKGGDVAIQRRNTKSKAFIQQGIVGEGS